MNDNKKTYLGDSVYATFDGYHIWLSTPQGMSIALEPSVLRNLNDYDAQLRADAFRENEKKS